MSRKKPVSLNIRMDKETDKRLREIAKLNGKSITQTVADIINRHWELLASSKNTDE